MAQHSQGATVSWGGIEFQEVFAISWQHGGDRQGMATPWCPNPGTLTVSCYGSAGCSTANYGLRDTLSSSGGGQSYSGPAIFNSLSINCEVNGATTYTVEFILCDHDA